MARMSMDEHLHTSSHVHASNNDNVDSDNDDSLLQHTQSMRKALACCRQSLETLQLDSRKMQRWTRDIEDRELALDAIKVAHNVEQLRKHTLGKANQRAKNGEPVIDVIDDLARIPTKDFRLRYLIGNQPCLIRGGIRTKKNTPSTSSECFAHVTNLWTYLIPDDDKEPAIRRDWFCRTLGHSALVPVRYQSNTCAVGLLDGDGRAAECKTQSMSISDWVYLLQEGYQDKKYDVDKGTISNYYLKDWHLQSLVEKNGYDYTEPLYSVPWHFQNDLLNDFMTRFTDGDYRFVYWGPERSNTALHSDVMNSLSWSFNVSGSKEWTFYIPCIDNASPQSSELPIVVRQNAGEVIFVPSTWKHKVVNLEETLSINHNWITTSNLDLVQSCLMSELHAVDEELKAWGITDWLARENMLRGCLGLDVSTFFFMCLIRGTDILSTEEPDNFTHSWEYIFDLTRISDSMIMLIQSKEACMYHRLEASLGGKDLSTEAIEVAKRFIEFAQALTERN